MGVEGCYEMEPTGKDECLTKITPPNPNSTTLPLSNSVFKSPNLLLPQGGSGWLIFLQEKGVIVGSGTEQGGVSEGGKGGWGV